MYNAAVPQVPLEQSRSSNLFKLFMNDVGILNSFYSNEVKLKIIRREKDINNGALFENAVAQLLVANGSLPYYYKNSKKGEVDFLVEKDGECLPIEVKSGKNYRSHRALSNLMNSSEYRLPEACVLSDDNVSVDGRVIYLPVYMVGLIKNSPLSISKIIPDLTGL